MAAGVVAKKMLQQNELFSAIKISSIIKEIGGNPDIEKGIEMAINNQDSVGGIIECMVTNLPVGLGEPFLIRWSP